MWTTLSTMNLDDEVCARRIDRWIRFRPERVLRFRKITQPDSDVLPFPLCDIGIWKYFVENIMKTAEITLDLPTLIYVQQ